MPNYAKAFPNSPIMHVDDDTQIACIDLPGETVRCIRRKPKLRVVLRKHRDVVFDINLGIGGQFSVESDESDFYNTRDKKLIRPKTKVSFAEGERLHLWVSRTFTGALLLKHNGKLIARYEPNQLDPHTCTAQNPEGKPAPLIVSMQVPHFDVLEPIQTQLDNTYEYYGAQARATEPTHQSMHVHEVQNWGENLPEEVLNFLQNGGDSTALDSSGLVTRNWIISQMLGDATYLHQNRELLKDIGSTKFKLQKIVHKSGKEAYYIIFKGNHKLREVMKGTKYLASNQKVLNLTFGAGSIKGMHAAAWENTKGLFKGSALISIAFTVTVDIAEWLQDYQKKDANGNPKRTVVDLLETVGIDLIKAGITAAATTACTALIQFILLAGLSFTAPVALAVIGIFVIGAFVDYKLSSLDKKYKISQKLKNEINEQAKKLESAQPEDYTNYSLLAP